MDKFGVVHICQAWGPAIEHTIIIVHVCEQFAYPCISMVISDVKLFVAQTGWILHQKRRLATNFFVKEFKQFILNAAIVGIFFSVDTAFKTRVTLNLLKS